MVCSFSAADVKPGRVGVGDEATRHGPVIAGGNEKQMSRGCVVRSLFLLLCCAAPDPAAPRVWTDDDTLADVISAVIKKKPRLFGQKEKWLELVANMDVVVWRALSADDKMRLPLDLVGNLNAELNAAAAPAPAPAPCASPVRASVALLLALFCRGPTCARAHCCRCRCRCHCEGICCPRLLLQNVSQFPRPPRIVHCRRVHV